MDERTIMDKIVGTIILIMLMSMITAMAVVDPPSKDKDLLFAAKVFHRGYAAFFFLFIGILAYIWK